jgi:arylsulfatase
MNVILLVIDTLRADHLGCYGYHRETSPNIDKLAKESVLFENAYPSDVPTQPSFTSMFTGLRGIHNGIVSHSITESLSEDIAVFPEILAINGVTTAAVSTLYTMRRWFARGFKYYHNPAAGDRRKLQQVDAEEINAFALPWIRDHRDEDFFLFLHYWDPHGLYKPPDEYKRLFYDGDESDPDNHSLYALKSHPIWTFTKRQVDAIGEDITDIEYIIAQYDGEIRYADDQVQHLLDALEDNDLTDETAFILTSDHGESLGEHGFYFDHFGVYETTIHVPLIIKHPQGAPIGTRVQGLVQSTTSIAPTVLSLFEIDPPKSMGGEDLIRIANGEESCPSKIYSNQGLWTAKRAIRAGNWKLVKTTHKAFWDTPDTELFNLDEDPLETVNLAGDEPETVDRLELQMTRWLRNELGGGADPLALIVSRGLPVYAWVEIVSKQTGLYETYEDWRTRVDRGEVPEARRGKASAPRW